MPRRENRANGSVIFAESDTLNQVPDSRPGIGYETLVGLPFNNNDFGENKIIHKLDGSTLALAPVEIFYASEVSTHPEGGPPGFIHGPFNTHPIPIPTPNWLYYYDQAWKNPFGYIINYDRDGSYYRDGDNHIHIGPEAHGFDFAPATDLFAYYGGELRYLGYEKTRGLDTYARVVWHESIHKRIYDLYAEQIRLGLEIDYDNDGLPDHVEVDVGLDPLEKSSVTDWPGRTNEKYSERPDFEVFARIGERELFASPELDWASDGLNYGNISPPNLGTRWVPRLNTPYDETPYDQHPWPTFPDLRRGGPVP